MNRGEICDRVRELVVEHYKAAPEEVLRMHVLLCDGNYERVLAESYFVWADHKALNKHVYALSFEVPVMPLLLALAELDYAAALEQDERYFANKGACCVTPGLAAAEYYNHSGYDQAALLASAKKAYAEDFVAFARANPKLSSRSLAGLWWHADMYAHLHGEKCRKTSMRASWRACGDCGANSSASSPPARCAPRARARAPG